MVPNVYDLVERGGSMAPHGNLISDLMAGIFCFAADDPAADVCQDANESIQFLVCSQFCLALSSHRPIKYHKHGQKLLLGLRRRCFACIYQINELVAYQYIEC